MGRQISIPLGNLAQDDIGKGIGAAIGNLTASLRRDFGDQFQIQNEVTQAQNEVEKDNRTVSLKVYKHQVTLRKGFLEGANIEFQWHRDKLGEIRVDLFSMSKFVEWCFRGTFIVAGILAIGYCIHIHVVGKIVFFLAYSIAFAALMIPYFCLRTLMGFQGNRLLQLIDVAVKNELGVSPPGNL